MAKEINAMPVIGWFIVILLILGIMACLSGCTTFHAEKSFDAQGRAVWVVDESTPPLISRKNNVSLRMEELDAATNTLLETLLTRSSDENANGQIMVMQALLEMLKAKYAVPTATEGGE